MQRIHRASGFTIVELLVVITIIVLLSTIILAAINSARENTREKTRLSDLANIELALTLFRESERFYPPFPDGAEIGTAGALDDIIKFYNGNTFVDPKNQDNVYEYWFDSDFTCYAPGQAVVYARTMEQSKNANYNEVCTHPDRHTTNGAGPNSYIIVFKQ